MVQRSLVGKLSRRHRGNNLAVVPDHHQAIVSHPPDLCPRQIPLFKNPLNLFLTPLVHDDKHAFLRFAQKDLVWRHIWRTLRHLGQVDLDASAAAGRRLAGGTGQAGCAHILNPRDSTRRQQLETSLHTELLHERVSYLDSTALLFGGFLG